ncbi:MAG: type III secretion system cytoplasmic ring protein SctQ [Chlamydiia bacterium]|nr:type III secretion system cytoplasmic ring protein SctQ [Chlamydiia bacterium]
MAETQTTTPYDWLRTLPASFKTIDEKPLFGAPPPFPLEEFTDKLRALLDQDTFSISYTEPRWVEQEALFAGMGDSLHLIPIRVTPLEGQLTFALTRQDLKSLLQYLLNDNHSPLPPLNGDYVDAFATFLASEALSLIQQCAFDNKLSFQLLSKATPPDEACLTLDITLESAPKSWTGRLLLDKTFQKSFKAHYSARTMKISPSMRNRVEIPLHVEVGKLTMPINDWKKVNKGDFVLLDHCSLRAEDEEKGRVLLTLNGTPVFRAKLKQGNIQILEFPAIHEEEQPMEPLDSEEEEETMIEDEDEDSEWDTEEEFNEDEDSEWDTEEEFNEDEEEEDEEEEEFNEDEEEEDEEEEEQEAKAPSAPAVKQRPLPKPEEIPLHIAVEVGKLNVTLQKLAEMQPGNLLDLNVHPEDGVDLVINGKCIGKGELLRMGESLGVRIIEIG